MVGRIYKLFRRGRPHDEHAEFRNLSSEYIDGELPEATAQKVTDHLKWCPPCQSFFETLKATVGLLGSLKAREAPESFKKDLYEKLRREGQ